jgi:hypothetical protein
MHIISEVNVLEFTLENRVISGETKIKPMNDAHRVIRTKTI